MYSVQPRNEGLCSWRVLSDCIYLHELNTWRIHPHLWACGQVYTYVNAYTHIHPYIKSYAISTYHIKKYLKHLSGQLRAAAPVLALFVLPPGWVCVCVCARAHARGIVCVCVSVRACVHARTLHKTVQACIEIPRMKLIMKLCA